MKKIFPLLLCACVGVRSYQQNLTANQFTVSPGKDLASALISTPSDNKAPTSTCNGKRIYLTKGGDNGIYLDGHYFNYSAGDTLVLKASQNPYSYVTFHFFNKGTASCPVVVTNEGGQVILTNYNGDAIPGGFEFYSSQHIRVTGTGSNTKYGFLITTPDNRGLGINVYGHSAHFEIDHLDIYKKGCGMWIKQEADCADSMQFPHWVLNDFSIHDNRMRNLIQEGMYLGSSDPNGSRGVYCNGTTIYPIPLRLSNFSIYNNIIDSSGRGGIQLSGADQGKNEIYNNRTTNIGYEFNTAQGNGIVLGGYTHAYVHDNYIDSTYSSGIYSLGSGLVKITNNIVNHSGMLAKQTTNGMSSIMIDTRWTNNPTPGQSNPVMLTFKLKDNQLGVNTDYSNNIRVYNTVLTYTTYNAICRNMQLTSGGASKNQSAQYAVATGIAWKDVCDTALTSTTASSTTANTLKSSADLNTVFPNPARDLINVNLHNSLVGKLAMNIYDEQGRMVTTKTIYKNTQTIQTPVDVSKLSSGVYTIQIMGETGKAQMKFIKQ